MGWEIADIGSIQGAENLRMSIPAIRNPKAKSRIRHSRCGFFISCCRSSRRWSYTLRILLIYAVPQFI
jgi:hypothetical protein